MSLNIGIIGLGKMGQNHLRELERNDNFKITALFDLAKNADFKYPFFTNLSDFLAQKLDAVIIATPTITHLSVAKEVFKKVKLVLIEKPLAMNLKEINELESLAKTYANKVAVGFCERFNPAIISLKQSLKNESITSINIQRFSAYPSRISDVGILQDLAVHDLDLLGFLSKKHIDNWHILKAYTKDELRESESVIACRLDKIIACVHQSWNASTLGGGALRRVQVVCKDSFYEANMLNFSLNKNGQNLEIISNLSPLFAEHNELFKLANDENTSLADINAARVVQEILQGA